MSGFQVVTFGMSARVGNISFPVLKRTEPAKKFYSDKLAKLMDEVNTDVFFKTGKLFRFVKFIATVIWFKLN